MKYNYVFECSKTGCNRSQPVFDRSLIFSKSRQPQPKPNSTGPLMATVDRLPSVQLGPVPVFFPVLQPDFKTLLSTNQPTSNSSLRRHHSLPHTTTADADPKSICQPLHMSSPFISASYPSLFNDNSFDRHHRSYWHVNATHSLLTSTTSGTHVPPTNVNNAMITITLNTLTQILIHNTTLNPPTLPFQLWLVSHLPHRHRSSISLNYSTTAYDRPYG